MKTTMFKVLFLFLISFSMIQSSKAEGRYDNDRREYREHYDRRGCGERREYRERHEFYAEHYCRPRFAPVVAPCYERVFIPGHYIINPWGIRVYVGPCYR